MSNEKLAEALGDAEATVLAFLGDVAFDGSVCGIKQAIVKGMFARLQAHAADAARVPDWTDAQCVAFMAVGLRHTEYKKGKSPTVEEIRQGAKAALAAQENPNGV